MVGTCCGFRMLPRDRRANKGMRTNPKPERDVKRTRRLLGACVLAFLILGVQACDDTMTGPETTDGTTTCYWFDGTLHCIET